jgi:hypothetical protein
MAHSSHRTTEVAMKTTGGFRARLRKRTPVVTVARNSKHLVEGACFTKHHPNKGEDPNRW